MAISTDAQVRAETREQRNLGLIQTNLTCDSVDGNFFS